MHRDSFAPFLISIPFSPHFAANFVWFQEYRAWLCQASDGRSSMQDDAKAPLLSCDSQSDGLDHSGSCGWSQRRELPPAGFCAQARFLHNYSTILAEIYANV
jgi:hypothetical protein